jgi:hypothetical protein
MIAVTGSPIAVTLDASTTSPSDNSPGQKVRVSHVFALTHHMNEGYDDVSASVAIQVIDDTSCLAPWQRSVVSMLMKDALADPSGTSATSSRVVTGELHLAHLLYARPRVLRATGRRAGAAVAISLGR